MMRRGFLSMRNGCWKDLKERYRKEGRSSEWSFEGIREAYEKVAKDEIGRLGICAGNSEEKHGLPATDHRGSRWNGGSHFVVCLLTLQQFPLGGPHLVGFFRVRRWKPQKEKHCNLFCAACGGHYEWRAPNRILVVQLGVNANEAKVLKAHAAPLELCDNLINELKLLANQQKDGDSPIQSIVTGLHERSRNQVSFGGRRPQGPEVSLRGRQLRVS